MRNAEERPGSFTPKLARIVATVSVSFVVTQLDVTIVNIAIPTLSTSLHASVAMLQWIVDAYIIAFAGLMLSAGALGDRFGARAVFASGIMLFGASSFVCGIASNPTMLIWARVVQGLAAALMLPNSLSLLNYACKHDPKLRARAVGLWTAAGGIALTIGPIVGGVLIAVSGWRSIFYANVPICLFGLLATFAWLPPSETNHAKKPRVDWIGQGLAVAALTCFTVVVIELRTLGWFHPLIIGGAILTYYGMLFVLSLYLRHARDYTALQAGFAFLPLTGGFLVSPIVSGWMVGRFGARIPMVAGSIIAAIGYGLLYFADSTTPLAYLLVAFLLLPGGMGLAVPAMTTTVLGCAQLEHAGIASAVLNAARQAGGAVGVAIFGALAVGVGGAAAVLALKEAAMISVVLLFFSAALACRVRPELQTLRPVATARSS
jgi:DHA2 family methylenomycin A resistance protein-like MFS transporter